MDLQELASSLDLESGEAYFQYITDSLLNGQRKQANGLFIAMSVKDRKAYLDSLEDSQTAEMVKVIISGIR